MGDDKLAHCAEESLQVNILSCKLLVDSGDYSPPPLRGGIGRISG